MKTIADKVADLGGELAPPASSGDIAELEARLGFSLPESLLALLSKHNGSLKETDEAIWRFWPCAEITTHRDYRNQDEFSPDNSALCKATPSAGAVALPGSNLILFADSMIDLPTYGVFHSPGHRYHGRVFDASLGYLSAFSFGEWIAAFIDHGEDGLLIAEQSTPEQAGESDGDRPPN